MCIRRLGFIPSTNVVMGQRDLRRLRIRYGVRVVYLIWSVRLLGGLGVFLALTWLSNWLEEIADHVSPAWVRKLLWTVVLLSLGVAFLGWRLLIRDKIKEQDPYEHVNRVMRGNRNLRIPRGDIETMQSLLDRTRGQLEEAEETNRANREDDSSSE